MGDIGSVVHEHIGDRLEDMEIAAPPIPHRQKIREIEMEHPF